MPSGSMPTYAYRANKTDEPFIKTRSTRRARLFIGGTYFRARDPGGEGNKISIRMEEFTSTIPGEEGELKGKLIVTNHNTLYAENVNGPAEIELLDQELNWNERYTIENLTTKPIARRYSISLKIAVGMALEEELGEYTFNKLFYVKNKLACKLKLKNEEVTSNSIIVIKPRVRVYDLKRESKTTTTGDGGEGGSTTITTEGWSIEDLRKQINDSDPWIEMMPRSGIPKAVEGQPPPQAPNPKFDEQDDEVDDDFLSIFSDTYLENGDGLPPTPVGESTGPIRSIIHINYGEQYNGMMGNVNKIYEWAGDTSNAGYWKQY
jgi:hypothetical protein